MLALTRLEVPLTTEENVRFKGHSRVAAEDFDKWGEMSVSVEVEKNGCFSWKRI